MNYEEGCPVFEEFLQRILNEKLCLRGYTGSGLIGEENSGINGKSIDRATCIYETSAVIYERIRRGNSGLI